ncbi:MAG: universal stress protein [Pseudomonadota bacterium]
MVKTILIPTDGSEYGRTAIDFGVYIAKKLGAKLIGLHVVDIGLMRGPVFSDISGSIGLPPYQDFLPVIEAGLDERAETVLKTFRERCEAAGLHPETIKATGVIDETIIEEGKKTDWILLAQRGENFHLAKGGILGSTAELVVRNSGKPVLVTPKIYRDIESMALAYDGSPPADNALKLAVNLSEKAAWPLTIICITDNQAVADRLHDKIETYLEPFQIDSETIIIEGKDNREILKFIQEDSVELLVMGAYGHNRLRQLFIGSTTSDVIQKSRIPVLLTR